MTLYSRRLFLIPIKSKHYSCLNMGDNVIYEWKELTYSLSLTDLNSSLWVSVSVSVKQGD